MKVETTMTGVEELKVNDRNDRRRRRTDIAQPLDYVAKELVTEFIQNQQRTSQPQQSFIKKLINPD